MNKNHSKILAIIPARSGSKGVANKNIFKINEKPLISWTINSALNSNIIKKVIVSTDSKEIAKEAMDCGCDVPFIRPKYLAKDTTPSIDVVLHALGELKGYDYVILLQPTSPLRTSEDIDNAINLMLSKRVSSCVSINETRESPYHMFHYNDGEIKQFSDSSSKFQRRQDLPKIYILNGAIYISSVSKLLKTKKFINSDTVGYVMPLERSLDIDTMDDMNFFKQIIKNNTNAK